MTGVPWRAGSLRGALAATEHFRPLRVRARPAPKQPEKEERKGMTLPELEALLRADGEAKETSSSKYAG